MKFRFLFLLIIFSLNSKLFSYELNISGIEKLSFDDLQTLTDLDLKQKNFTSSEIDKLINDFYSSDLIYEVDLSLNENTALIMLSESKIINNIFINNNTYIDDDIIANQLLSKKGSLLKKNNLKIDIENIIKLYKYKGYRNTQVNLSIESFSADKINIIYSIEEGTPSKIVKINFFGNKFFSDGYLNNIIISEKISPINIFKNSSNLDESIFDFDLNKISNLYKKYGFIDIDITYSLINKNQNNLELSFYIQENQRYKVSDIQFITSLNDISDNLNNSIENLKVDLEKDNSFYNQKIVDQYLDKLNYELSSNNFNNYSYSYLLDINQNSIDLKFIENKLDPIVINKIDIFGNSITKENTIRSKILFQPGDIYNQFSIDRSKENLNSLNYINKVDIFNSVENDKSNISINIEENTRTGSAMFGGSLSGDTGFGVAFTLKDYNFLGTGDEINSSFNINSERYLFDISYKDYPSFSSNIKNTYNIFNSEVDLTDSFGFKSRSYGIGYGITFDYDEKTDISAFVKYINENNHSAINSNNAITDNIGDFDSIEFQLSYYFNTTNDILYPTRGTSNNFSIVYRPDSISDDPFYKITLNNKYFKPFERNDSFIYVANNLGYADSLNGNLKTTNIFSLGGNNFKGFDYRGIGSFDDSIYLGGNKFFTSTIGYGDNFVFDEKDNIMMKIFYTTGSIWDSDYSNDDFELRSSLGLSLDFLTVIPLTMSYSIPIVKNSSDKTRNFNFFLGTSF